ncbi:electron transport complex subunit E [Neiella sp. HB171785]|uniref:Ion-translocating oxidoreductase complex subunit E n=2 Tax=Neiella TaxID=1434025 RepID=A0A8J6QNV8_9GAMM|nr:MULTISPECIES: electron transport complex subunit E [Neiella]MBD1388206.1 electron transport complex subunit E [Neiella litorisoli]GGA76830.1 electron transport complex subunit RnfE [Neiella marina]
MTDYRSIFAEGLWRNNVVLSQCLALCPLLAVTSSATNGLGLGLATLAVMVCANLLASVFQPAISRAVRIPINILMIATLVTLTDLLLNAWMHSLHKVLGLFIPLIVTNCAILGRVESFASKQAPVPAIADGVAMGLGFTWVLVVLGGFREVLGSGTLFADASLLLGSSFEFLELTIIPDYRGLLLMILPPGGFLVLGFMLMAQRLLQTWLQSRQLRIQGEQSCA